MMYKLLPFFQKFYKILDSTYSIQDKTQNEADTIQKNIRKFIKKSKTTEFELIIILKK